MYCTSIPAVEIKRTISKHFKILDCMFLFCICIVKGIFEGDTIHFVLCYTMIKVWCLDTKNIVNRRRNVIDMSKLRVYLTVMSDLFRPGDNHWVSGTAKIGSNQFGTLERC